MLSLYRSEEGGESIGIIVENELINELEINLKSLIITTFNHWAMLKKLFVCNCLFRCLRSG